MIVTKSNFIFKFKDIFKPK